MLVLNCQDLRSGLVLPGWSWKRKPEPKLSVERKEKGEEGCSEVSFRLRDHESDPLLLLLPALFSVNPEMKKMLFDRP